MYAPQTCFDNDFFFSGKPEGADGEDMETESHVDTQVSLIQPQACQFLLDYCFYYFVVFFFFRGDKQVAHLACHTWQLTDEFSLALISCRPTCDVVASCNWKCFAIGSIGLPAHLRLIVHILKFARNTHQTGAIFNHFTCLTGVCT